MKAYEVGYDTPEKSTTAIILTEDESTLEVSLSLKDTDYVIGQNYTSISYKQEIPLSNVKIVDLSVTELLSLLNK